MADTYEDHCREADARRIDRHMEQSEALHPEPVEVVPENGD